jgi:hypothetical protein
MQPRNLRPQGVQRAGIVHHIISRSEAFCSTGLCGHDGTHLGFIQGTAAASPGPPGPLQGNPRHTGAAPAPGRCRTRSAGHGKNDVGRARPQALTFAFATDHRVQYGFQPLARSPDSQKPAHAWQGDSRRPRRSKHHHQKRPRWQPWRPHQMRVRRWAMQVGIDDRCARAHRR